MDFVPRHDFDACVRRHGGDSRPRGFTCRDQFLCMALAQLTFRESLRDIETCLRSLGAKLYHAGFRRRIISPSTLGDANQRTRLTHLPRPGPSVDRPSTSGLYAGDRFGVELENAAYAFDATTIDLCLNLFPWAPFRRHKAAVKLHTLLDLRGNIPTFIRISSGKTHEVNVLDELLIEPGTGILRNGTRRISTSPDCFVSIAPSGLLRAAGQSQAGLYISAARKSTNREQIERSHGFRPNDRFDGSVVVATLSRPLATRQPSTTPRATGNI